MTMLVDASLKPALVRCEASCCLPPCASNPQHTLSLPSPGNDQRQSKNKERPSRCQLETSRFSSCPHSRRRDRGSSLTSLPALAPKPPAALRSDAQSTKTLKAARTLKEQQARFRNVDDLFMKNCNLFETDRLAVAKVQLLSAHSAVVCSAHPPCNPLCSRDQEMYREIIHAQLGYHCAAVQSLSHAARLVAELDPDAEATVRSVDVVGIVLQSKSMPCRVFSLFFPPMMVLVIRNWTTCLQSWIEHSPNIHALHVSVNISSSCASTTSSPSAACAAALLCTKARPQVDTARAGWLGWLVRACSSGCSLHLASAGPSKQLAPHLGRNEVVKVALDEVPELLLLFPCHVPLVAL